MRDAAPVAPPPPIQRSFGSEPQPAPSIRREPGTSLRDSILKKPLSSLYNKD
ncbi:hypothetical protein D3C87_2168380 [compost metagenome]